MGFVKTRRVEAVLYCEAYMNLYKQFLYLLSGLGKTLYKGCEHNLRASVNCMHVGVGKSVSLSSYECT